VRVVEIGFLIVVGVMMVLGVVVDLF